MGSRVIVAMSGGVDSSVAAAMMVEAGHEVVGITMSLVKGASRCCSLDDTEDARRVAERLGIRFYVANYKDEFEEEVIRPFAASYLRGETPIPCVGCNSRFKFRYLLERAEALGADTIITGHFAQIRLNEESGLLELFRGQYEKKDQSYFLFELGQEQLRRISFPLGEMTKAEVREHARSLGLSTADKPESQEICFVPEGHYVQIVERYYPDELPGAGDIVNASGEVLGQHQGLHYFTVGQRKGLGIASLERLYVTDIDVENNRVVVGEAHELDSKEARVCRVNWIAGKPPEGPVRAQVRVRHGHAGTAAEIQVTEDDEVRVCFDSPVRSVTPGQAAVFYDGDKVLGGGWIA